MTSGPVEESGGRLLASDIGVIYLLLNEARYRTLARLFGVSREQAHLATLVFVAALAEAARARAERLRGRARPARGAPTSRSAGRRSGSSATWLRVRPCGRRPCSAHSWRSPSCGSCPD